MISRKHPIYWRSRHASHHQCHASKVFITGCDSGIGLSLAQRLKDKQYEVFASALTPQGEAELSKLGIHGFQMDITSERDVQKQWR
jgi:NAD(P)-dependent dehydrogenase (short-subunit alcohol dehydrogenase family)